MSLLYFFIPHKKNNYHPYLIRNFSLFLLSLLIVASFNLPGILEGDILGTGSNIAKDEIVRLTNEQRTTSGLASLNYNPQLEQAAILKAQDMFSKNYWAHTSPDGETPWSFFSKAGYSFKFAGENLAKDFDNSSQVVSGWMESSGHKENILNANFTEIGVGVMNGNLNGSETTLVVQMFGTTTTPATVASAPVTEDSASATPLPVAVTLNQELTSSDPSLVKSKPSSNISEKKIIQATPNLTASFSSFPIYEKIAFTLLSILLTLFVLDKLYLRLAKVRRTHTGETSYHILTLGGLLILLVILIQGAVI